MESQQIIFNESATSKMIGTIIPASAYIEATEGSPRKWINLCKKGIYIKELQYLADHSEILAQRIESIENLHLISIL